MTSPPTAGQLLALTQTCQPASTSDYENAYSDQPPANIPVCKLNGAVFWKSGMYIDCDGLSCNTTVCTLCSNSTAAQDSHGHQLDSATLPFVPLPAISGCTPLPWSYAAAGIKYGTVVAVIYGSNLTYAVFGDVNDCMSIGGGSFALADSLGIPTPSGVPDSVTYIVFTGTGTVATPIEDHTAATVLGQQLAMTLLTANP
jgi:hypothetical protein